MQSFVKSKFENSNIKDEKNLLISEIIKKLLL